LHTPSQRQRPKKNFNQFFTGYGFTSNTYGEAQMGEFWVNNALYEKLDYAAVPLDCSKSSVPIEQQAVSVAEAGTGFVPTLVGYREA
jgi:hypothetical protein